MKIQERSIHVLDVSQQPNRCKGSSCYYTIIAHLKVQHSSYYKFEFFIDLDLIYSAI